MADDQSLNSILKSASEFDQHLNLFKDDPEKQQQVLNGPLETATSLLKEKGVILDSKALSEQRLAYHTAPQSQRLRGNEQSTQSTNRHGGPQATGNLTGFGVLAGAKGLEYLTKEKKSAEDIEKLSHVAGEEKANEWNKTKDYSKARSFFHAYEQGQVEYYDNYVKKNLDHAKNLAKTSPNRHLLSAINKAEDENKGIAAQTSPTIEQLANKRMELINKLAAKKTLTVPASKKDTVFAEERRKFLKRFAEKDPIMLSEYLKNSKTGKADAIAQDVWREKLAEEDKVKKAIEKNQNRRATKLTKVRKNQMGISGDLSPTPIFTRTSLGLGSRFVSTPKGNSRKRSIPGINKLGSKLQNIANPSRLMQQIAQTVFKNVLRGPLIALSLFVFIAFLLTFIFIFLDEDISGGAGESSADTVSSTCSEGKLLPISTANFDNYFNVKGVSASQKQEIYDILALPMASDSYKNKLTKEKITIAVNNNGGSCGGGHVYSSNSITLDGFFNCGIGNKRYFLIHETGHIIDQRGDFKFSVSDLKAKDDSCYSSNSYLISYPYTDSGANGRSESFAEAISQYVLYGSNDSPPRSYLNESRQIEDYPSTCPATYSWARVNIFGGADFFSENTCEVADAETPSVFDIITWGRKINSSLQTVRSSGGGCPRFNKLTSRFTNGDYTTPVRQGDCSGLEASTYFCTTLVRDAYNLAGIKNKLSEYTPSMVDRWESISGLTLLKENNVKLLAPGDAIFWYGLSSSSGTHRYRHTALVDKIEVNSSGNGVLYSIDANVDQKRLKHMVRNWKLLDNIWGTPADYVTYGLSPR